MANLPQEQRLIICLTEYEKLKDEQIARIGFRDNLVYATLIAIGGILSFALGASGNLFVLLILPLATFALGWIYLNNDYKISAIGRYIRNTLTHRLCDITGDGQLRALEWELVYKSEPYRTDRKVLQLFINQALFVGSGVAAIVVYLATASPNLLLQGLALIELMAMLILAYQIAIFADFRRKPGE